MSEFSYYISQSVKYPIKPGSAGFPQPGHDVKLLNPETLEEVKADEEGMICIPENDPGLFIKYWNMDQETSKYKNNNWFFTGDFARYDKEGYLWFLGRKDDIIKSFGYRVSPYEIERVFKSHKLIENCVALGEKQEDGKVLVVIYIILNKSSHLHPNQFVQYGRENLAAYKAPKIVYIATEFPKTKNGKILRKQITKEIIIEKSDVR
jgi:acyl-coenzyme A synthetase/AMP-(fatty) acid ligase